MKIGYWFVWNVIPICIYTLIKKSVSILKKKKLFIFENRKLGILIKEANKLEQSINHNQPAFGVIFRSEPKAGSRQMANIKISDFVGSIEGSFAHWLHRVPPPQPRQSDWRCFLSHRSTPSPILSRHTQPALSFSLCYLYCGI